MKCPYCETEMTIPDVVSRNVLCYGKAQTIPTPCCGKGILVRSSELVAVTALPGPQREDNWGDAIQASEFSEIVINETQYAR